MIKTSRQMKVPLTFITEMEKCQWQRNTEERVKRMKHLRSYGPDHLHMACAELPDGGMILVDGHSRELLWRSEPKTNPATLGHPRIQLDVYPVDAMDDVKVLYDRFNSREAVENSRDRIYGGYRAVDWYPLSSLLQHGKIKTAMELACDCVEDGPTTDDEHELIVEWLSELKTIDLIQLNRNYMNSGVLAAALATLRRWSDDDPHSQVLLFWENYHQGLGFVSPERMDGVAALRWLIDQNRKDLKRRDTSLNILQKALECVEYFNNNRMFTLRNGKPRLTGLPHTNYIPNNEPAKKQA